MADVISTTKSFVLGVDNVTYFEVTRTTYDDGTYFESSTRIGTAADLTADQADKIEGRARLLANDAQAVSQARRILNEQNSIDSSTQAITGQSPLKVIQDRYQAELLKPGWTIDEGAGFVPIVFTVNAQGNLRYNVNGTGGKAARIYGDVIRLNNYPASPTDTDFFATDNGGRFFSLPNRNVIIKKP